MTKYRLFILSSLIIIILSSGVAAQKPEDPQEMKARAQVLFDQLKYTDALPLYETLAKQLPKDAAVLRNFAFALLAQGANTQDAETRRQLRIRARDMFMMARDAGDDSLLVKGMIEGLPVDGSDGSGFSDNAEANKAMQKGEAFFTNGKTDDAFNAYQEALKLDPRCYHAALFSGDVKMHTVQYDEAEKWYQRAIAIDPYQETAYRYSATPLMKQGKYDLARDRYVEAYILAPYNKLAVSGIVQWAQLTKTPVSHPKLDIPETSVGADGKENVNINISPVMDDGSMAWMAYVTTREDWKKTKFAKAHPKEPYRHTVAEEADALRSVVSMAKTLKPKSLNTQIATIDKMDKDGVLEAYVLMAIPDRSIALEHAAYVRANRERLRQYVLKYVISPK